MITCRLNLLPVQAIHVQINKDGKRRTIYSLFAVCIQTVLLEELIESVEQTRSDAQSPGIWSFTAPRAVTASA